MKFKRKQPEEGQASHIVFEVSDKEPPSWQRVPYQMYDITPDQTQDIRQIFQELTKAHDTVSNACGLITALSTDLKEPGLNLLLQNSIWPLVSVKIPEGIFVLADTSDNENKDKTSQNDILKEIIKTCFLRPCIVEDANDGTHVLAALVYFKLKQQLLGGAKQFEAAVRYKVPQKCLSEFLHGKKYLGGKQGKRKKEQKTTLS